MWTAIAFLFLAGFVAYLAFPIIIKTVIAVFAVPYYIWKDRKDEPVPFWILLFSVLIISAVCLFFSLMGNPHITDRLLTILIIAILLFIVLCMLALLVLVVTTIAAFLGKKKA
jgi:hypothetical protein